MMLDKDILEEITIFIKGKFEKEIAIMAGEIAAVTLNAYKKTDEYKEMAEKAWKYEELCK